MACTWLSSARRARKQPWPLGTLTLKHAAIWDFTPSLSSALTSGNLGRITAMQTCWRKGGQSNMLITLQPSDDDFQQAEGKQTQQTTVCVAANGLRNMTSWTNREQENISSAHNGLELQRESANHTNIIQTTGYASINTAQPPGYPTQPSPRVTQHSPAPGVHIHDTVTSNRLAGEVASVFDHQPAVAVPRFQIPHKFKFISAWCCLSNQAQQPSAVAVMQFSSHA